MAVIAAIPTLYNGVQFRSRLEARWAAFFDLIGCAWEYEPVDFNGYTPDFIVHAHYVNQVTGRISAVRRFVEIKPYPLDDSAMLGAFQKAADAGCDPGVWVAGRELECNIQARSVVLANILTGSNGDRFLDVVFLQYDGRQFYTAFREDLAHDMMRGQIVDQDGNILDDDDASSIALSLWREAGNRVQWRGAKSVTHAQSHS